jgi:hypothetical protein
MATKRRQEELRLQFAYAAFDMIGHGKEELSSSVQQRTFIPIFIVDSEGLPTHATFHLLF